MKRAIVLILLCLILFLQFSSADGIDRKFCKESSYSLQDPCITVDPYQANPLSALVQFITEKPAQISLEIAGRDGAQPIKTTFKEFSKLHKIPVLGLYPNYNNSVTLTATYEDKTVETVSLNIPTKKVKKHAMYVVTRKDDNQTNYYWMTEGLVLDEDGWFRFVFDNEEGIHYYFPGQIVTEDRIGGLKTYSLLGKFEKAYPYPKGFTSFTHGIALTPTGNFLVIGSREGKSIQVKGETLQTQRDVVIEIDKDSGKVLREIDLGELLYPNRAVLVREGVEDFGLGDWCHINGVDYDEQDGSWLVSCRFHGISKITSDGKLDWLITPKKGLEKSGRDGKGPALYDKVLTAVDADGKPYPQEVQMGDAPAEDFKWPTRNHLVKVVGKNLYAFYDNSGPVYDPDLFTTENSNATVVRVDPVKRTVQTVWKEALPVRSDSGSNVVYDPTKNRVLVYSSAVNDKNQEGLVYGMITRYDLETHRPLFSAQLNKGSANWIYQLQPFEFYPDNQN